jgi:hypothetical protein
MYKYNMTRKDGQDPACNFMEERLEPVHKAKHDTNKANAHASNLLATICAALGA